MTADRTKHKFNLNEDGRYRLTSEMNLPPSFTAKADRLPPCMLRLFAKRNGVWASNKQLMDETGWGSKKLKGVFNKSTFGRVDAFDIDTAYALCGVSWSSQRKERWRLQCLYEKGGLKGIAKMRHLRPRTPWQKKNLNYYLKLVEEIMMK